ncbi:MAG: type II toxin-antitoxin system prevent-host-death family antitoxin [Pseudomonadota bacterium]
MPPTSSENTAAAWRLQDAKAQFSELVNNAMRGVPQHVMRRGKRAVVVLSEQDFEALQRGAANQATKPASLVDHLLAIPKISGGAQASGLEMDVQPRDLDFS